MLIYINYSSNDDSISDLMTIVRHCDWGSWQLSFQSSSVLFLAVLHPRLATTWTYFLYLSLSSVILTDSSTESPVHILMLSIQAVCGLPRLRASGIVPCIISFSTQLHASFLALTVSNSSVFTPALLRTHSFVFLAVHETRRIFWVLSSQRCQDDYPKIRKSWQLRISWLQVCKMFISFQLPLSLPSFTFCKMANDVLTYWRVNTSI